MLKLAFYTPNPASRHPKDGEAIRGERWKFSQQNHFPAGSSTDSTAGDCSDPELDQTVRRELRAQAA